MDKFDAIRSNLNKSKWSLHDYRNYIFELTEATQIALESFSPISNITYEKNPIQLIDFFSGAGGTSLGFASLNSIIPAFKMLGGCDINEISANTYAHNFGTPMIHEDITKLAYENGRLDDFLTYVGYDENKPLVLIGCAPCQGFSSHGKKRWNEEDDIRNSLIMAFAEIVKRLKPDAILMENVPEFLSKRYWNYFSAAKKCYTENGYFVKSNIHNAANFGVPQERFRSIIIGMKKNFILPQGYLLANEFRTVRDTIGSLLPVEAGVADPKDPMHKSAAHKQSTINVMRQVPHNGGNRPVGVGPACLDKVNGFSDVYGRLFWDKPSITITHYARNPASGRYTHPEQDRGLTARESALLQSFPNGFEFMGKADDIFRQIGEAVPPMLSAAIAAHLLIELLSTTPSKEQLSKSPSSIENPVSSSYSSVIAGIKTKGKAIG